MLILSGPAASIGQKATFGFVIRFESGAPAPTGNLTYNDHASNVTIKEISYDLLVITGTHAMFRGTASVNGASQQFTVNVDDLGEPGSSDTFSIDTSGGYMASGVLTGGDIQIH